MEDATATEQIGFVVDARPRPEARSRTMAKVAKPRKHGSRWQINFLDVDWNRRFETFATPKEASAALALRKAEVEEIRAGARPRPPDPHTFSDHSDDWLGHRTAHKRSQ